MKRGTKILSFTILVSLSLIVLDRTLSMSAVAMDEGPSASGHYDLLIAGGRQTVSFSANNATDGSVHGTFQAKSRGQNSKIHGDINCLYIDGTTAYLNGVITNGDIDGFPVEGWDVIFKVQDNGEGVNSNLDLATDLFLFTPGSIPTCDRSFHDFFTMNAVEAGNIQVKP